MSVRYTFTLTKHKTYRVNKLTFQLCKLFLDSKCYFVKDCVISVDTLTPNCAYPVGLQDRSPTDILNCGPDFDKLTVLYLYILCNGVKLFVAGAKFEYILCSKLKLNLLQILTGLQEKL